MKSHNAIFTVLILSIITVFLIVGLSSCQGKSQIVYVEKKPRIIPEVDLLKIDKKVQNINAGGCGYFALKLYDKLSKDDYELVQINDLSHVVLKEKQTGLFIDSKGYHTEFGLRLYFGNDAKLSVINECDLKRWVDSCGLWNPSFDRRDTVLINTYISKLY